MKESTTLPSHLIMSLFLFVCLNFEQEIKKKIIGNMTLVKSNMVKAQRNNEQGKVHKTKLLESETSKRQFLDENRYNSLRLIVFTRF